MYGCLSIRTVSSILKTRFIYQAFMPEQTAHAISSSSTSEIDALIAGKSLGFYWKVSKFFILLMVVLEIANVILELYRYGNWIIEIVLFAILTLWLLKRYRVKIAVALFASIMISIVSGLLLAIFDTIWYRELWYLLNLVRKPCIISVVGIGSTFIFYLLFQSIIFKQERNNPKGGGIYGRTKERTKASFNK